MTRRVHITEPADFKALIVRCRACKATVTLPLSTTKPAYECPGCRAAISLQRATRAADAIVALQQSPPDGCDIEFETTEPAE